MVDKTPTPAPGSLAAAVHAQHTAQATGQVPVGLNIFNSNDLGPQWFHGVIYGETDARKTSTAASFASPEDTLIILTRRKEQAKPLEGKGYRIIQVENSKALNYALQYPELLAPDWAKRPEPTLIVDDITEGVSKLVDAASDEVGEAFGRHHKEAGNQLREHVRNLMNRPMHLVMTALAKVNINQITKEERIAPNLPGQMLDLINTEVEFCFYIKKSNWQFLTTEDFFTYSEYDQDQKKDVTYRRQIFAKNKLPLPLALKVPPFLNKYEKMDLRGIWERVKAGK